MVEKLSAESVRRFNEWFQERVQNGCPFCGGREWTVQDEMAVTSTLEMGNHAIDARHGAPAIHVTCDQCAFTAAFSATRIGIVAADT